MPEPVRVLVAVAEPQHGASDRLRLRDMLRPLETAGVELRGWAQPRLLLPAKWTGDPVAAVAAGRAGPDDLAGILWADVIWLRRFAASTVAGPEGGEPRASGFDDLLRAIAGEPGLLRGRRVVYDLDADLLEPRAGSRAAGAREQRAQVELLLEIADVVTVATPALRDALARRVPADRLVVVGSGVDLAAYDGAARDPGRTPVVAAIDGLDGPGGIGAWVPELLRARRAGLDFRLVRLADIDAPEEAGFDEVVRAAEGDPAWPRALVGIAPDVVLAPLHGDRFGRTAPEVAWLEATAVGAATLADGRAPGPYATLVDGREALLVDGPRDVARALGDVLGSPELRAALAAGARARLATTATVDHRAGEWAAAFRLAATIEARSGMARPAGWAAARDARRSAIGRASLERAGSAAAATPAADAADPDSLALVGALPTDPVTMTAALDAARRTIPAPVEIVLAGTPDQVAAAATVATGGPAWGGAFRWVTVDPRAGRAATLAAAIAATTATWVGFLDPSAELRPWGVAELRAVAREHGLDAAFGELAVAGPGGAVERIGGWPPATATFRAPTLLVTGGLARGQVTPAVAELGDPVLDWLLALMEAGGRIGSAGVTVARELPAAARTTRVRSVGAGVPYADGGEDRLLGIVGSAADRGSTSDELARSIGDWTTRYHLSRLRGNLVHSVAFPPGARVVDVGAGTGTIARALGERGLKVVALEGAFDRARVAAVRCADLPGVEVVHGTVGDYEDQAGFDSVVVVGVLEYSGSFQGGAAGPAAFLGRLRGLLRPDGVLVLAIENRLGLKYLQGYAEDHLARPWVGIDGYGGSGGIRTWSRRALRSLLEGAGFPLQRWRYPFPDYKLPTLVVDEAAYREPDAASLVDALVREPIHDYAHARSLLRDDRGAHQGFLEAGLGEDVANSFLIVASADPSALERYAPSDGPLAWLYGDERMSRWLRRRTVERGADGRTVVMEGGGSTVDDGVLRQVRAGDEAFVVGRTLEQELKEALAAGGADGGARILREWVAAIDAEAARGAGRDAGTAPPAGRPARPPAVPTPLAPARGHAALPGHLLDVIPANFIRAADGTIVRVDREWQVAGPIDRDIALFRALWYVAGTIVRTAWSTPWPPDRSIRQIAHDLAAIASVPDDEARFERFCVAEAWLQARVLGGDPVGAAVGTARMGTITRAQLDPVKVVRRAA